MRSHPPSGDALAVTLWMGLVMVGASLALLGMAALAPQVMASMGWPAETIGLFSSMVWAAALLISPTGGMLVQRWGAWPVSRACVALCALGVACVALGNAVLFWLGALLIGLGHGLEAPPSSQLLSHYIAPAQRPLFFSIKQTGVQLGAVIASLSLPVLALHWGWQPTLAGLALVLAGLALGLAWPSRRQPGAAPGAAHADDADHPFWRVVVQTLRTWVPALQRRPGLLRLSVAASAYGATQVCMNAFLVTWGVQERGFDLPSAGLLAAAAQAAGMLGRPLWGWVASRVVGPARLLFVLGLVMTGCGLLLGATGRYLPVPWLIPLVALFGMSASGWNGVFLAQVAALSVPGEEGRTTGAAMVPLLMGLIIGPMLFSLAARQWSFTVAFMALASVSLLGALLALSSTTPQRSGADSF